LSTINEDIYADLRHQSLGWTLILIGAGTWTALLLADMFSTSLPSEWVAGAVAAISICAVLYMLRANHLQLACYMTVICMWASNALIAFLMPQPLFLYLFGLVIVLSGSLVKVWTTIVLAVASTLVIIILSGGQALAVGPLINIWGSLIAGVVVTRRLYQALETISQHHDYTIEQMNLARDHRALLVKLTKALQEATENLGRANIQLRYAREAADEARHLKAQFAANVSHELRTPINLVIGYSEVMVMAPEIYGAPLPQAYRSDIHAIYRNAKHLQDLINDILDISQIEASRLVIAREKSDLRATLLEGAQMVNDLVAGKGLQFHLELPEALPEVWIDRTRIRQVVLNLLANAVRFTDKGTITLRASEHRGELTVSITDTGIGICKDDLGRVFEEFYQSKNTVTKNLMGTGLGLTLSMHVVHHHGGRLWAESAGIGYGSTFSFTLPTSASAQYMAGSSASTIPYSQNPKCVIIFDDDVAVGQLFKRYLNKHEVVISRSKEDVLRLTATIQPSAVVLDRKFRNTEIEAFLSKSSCDTALVFCPMPSGRRSLQAYGAAEYLVKPVTRQALTNAILALGKPVRSVLIIDDERDVTRMLSHMIAAFDRHCTVWQANNGPEGLAIVYREHPDVVLLDIQMPVMDGFSILDRMKHDPVLQEIPVIIASAHGAGELISSAIEGELTVVRPSGLSPDDLVNCVEAVVNVLTPPTPAVNQGS
jgi:signal transduction histidine kinase/CheY-like chemotaxis protein